MSAQHASSCGRRIALEYDRRGGDKEDAIAAIHRHCGVSLLRAHRLAHGYTLTAVADFLRNILNSSGIQAAGIAHQMVSRWENGIDSPSERYLDALCRLYKTRPDRLGVGRDYSVQAAAAPARAIGVAERPSASMRSGSARVIDLLEQRTEQSGYEMYTSAPAEFVPARMTDLATTQGLLLRSPAPGPAKRLHRIAAKNAGFIAIRLTDIASAGQTLNWFSLARQSAQHAEDRLLEAWIMGHMSGGYSCYGYSLARGLDIATIAQSIAGRRPSPAALLATLAEAGIQARLRHRRETLDAVRRSERLFESLPPDAIAADGIRISEYCLRWHQSNALTILGEQRLADPLRHRALELPMASGDLIGRALLRLDGASLAFRSGDPVTGCSLIELAWTETPEDLYPGQITNRTKHIIAGLPSSQRTAKETAGLLERLHPLTAQSTRPHREPS